MNYNVTETSIIINRNNDLETKAARFDGDIHLLPSEFSDLSADLHTLQRVYDRASTSCNPAIAKAYLALEQRVIKAFEREAEPTKKANHVAITTASLRGDA